MPESSLHSHAIGHCRRTSPRQAVAARTPSGSSACKWRERAAPLVPLSSSTKVRHTSAQCRAPRNPNTGSLNALIQGSFTYKQAYRDTEVTRDKDGNETTKTTTKFETFAATAVGQVNARVSTRPQQGFAGTTVRGFANVQFSLSVNNPFDEISSEVVGYKQSSLGSALIAHRSLLAASREWACIHDRRTAGHDRYRSSMRRDHRAGGI